ncbi:MAG: VOC family protein, partial [Deltaproteobacteria bacterium]|nr:VOC family protein [Deltaproteobacteria bacterium]
MPKNHLRSQLSRITTESSAKPFRGLNQAIGFSFRVPEVRFPFTDNHDRKDSNMQLRWSHAVLRVRDMDEMVDFYTKVLGFEVTDRGAFPGAGT